MKRVSHTWILSIASCWSGVSSAPPCPAAADKYRPDMPMETQFDIHVEANGIGNQPCAGGLTWDQAPSGDPVDWWIVAHCHAGICAEGYEGYYCVPREDFSRWVNNGNCPACVCARKDVHQDPFETCYGRCDDGSGSDSG